MAVSGSKNFKQTRQQLILDAFQLLGVYGIGRTLSAEDSNFANSLLNKMIKAWAARGLHLWAKEEGVLYLTPNVAKYPLGNASSDAYATTASDEIVTQLDSDAALATTSLTALSTTGMTIGDNIGVVQTNHSVHWTTIATIPTSTTLTISSGLSVGASSGTLVYTFTDKVYKPLRILDARKTTGFDSGATSSLFDLPLTSISYQEYMQLPIKTSGNTPNQFHYNPENISGDLYLWPRPTSGSERISFTFERMIDDLDEASDDFDFPSEWLECLTYQLAVRLGPAFGKDQRTRESIAPLASSFLENLLRWDSEIDSVTIKPDYGR